MSGFGDPWERGAVLRCCEKQDFLFSSSSDTHQLKLHQTTAPRWGSPVAWADLAARSCGQSLRLPPNTLPQHGAPRHTATGQVDWAGRFGRNLDSFSPCHPRWSEGWSDRILILLPHDFQIQVNGRRKGWEKGRRQAGHLGNCSPSDWLSYKDHNTTSPPILVFWRSHPIFSLHHLLPPPLHSCSSALQLGPIDWEKRLFLTLTLHWAATGQGAPAGKVCRQGQEPRYWQWKRQMRHYSLKHCNTFQAPGKVYIWMKKVCPLRERVVQ